MSTFGTLPALVDSTKDSRIFVGRSAPVSVKRGDSFQYVIFVGNLTNVSLGIGTVTFKVPEGCIGVNLSKYRYNALSATAEAGQILPAAPYNDANKVWTWSKPLAAGTQITMTTARAYAAEHPEFALRRPTALYNDDFVDESLTYWPDAWLHRLHLPAD